MGIQTPSELDAFYERPDPWGYGSNPDDERRKNELLSLLPHCKWTRVLDIGCGDGFITFHLPGQKIFGTDLSSKAIRWANSNRTARNDADRFEFFTSSLFELDPEKHGRFDLIVITGLLYPQYIGRSFSVVMECIDRLLENEGVIASCHIDEWHPPRFPYSILDVSLYPYREYLHRLEIYRK